MKISAGIIGFGIGKKHFDSIENYKGSKVKIICEKNGKLINELKKKYPDKIITNSEKIIFNDKNINLVSIASYDNYHFSQILKCIKTQKNFIVEKPMCLTEKELNILKKKLKKNKAVKMTSNLVLRTNDLFNKIKKKINRNNIFYIEGDYMWGRSQKLMGWRSKVNQYSIILGAAIHMIDLSIWLLEMRPIKVSVFANNIATRNSKFKKKSFALIVLTFPKNILVKITANSACVFNHFHELKVYSKDKTFYHTINNSIEFRKKNLKTTKVKIQGKYPDKENRKKLIRNFVDHLKNKNNRLLIKTNEQLDLMTVCLAAEKSMKKNKEIKIVYGS